MITGSSETTREAFVFNFNFNQYYQITGTTKQDKIFLEWFIGFSEGDGSFGLVKFPTQKNSKNQRPVFRINQKEPQILFKIKKNLGFGTVIHVKNIKQQYYRYGVYKLSDIKKLIELFNGNLLLKKTFQRFHNWVRCYNTLCNQQKSITHTWTNKKTLLLQQNVQFHLDSAWLAGFTDAEGGFYASLSVNMRYKLGLRLRLKYYLSQKDEFDLLKEIDKKIYFRALEKIDIQEKELIKPTKIRESDHVKKITKKENTYSFEIHHHKHIEELIHYFDTYALLTHKKITYVR